MAQMDTASGGEGKKGKPKKLSTRVDLTPMVDLAFLLITFFMLTTTMNKPQAMTINMPVERKPEDPPPPEIAAAKVLTLILGANNTIWYYEGLESPEIKNTTYQEIRSIILDKKKRVEAAVLPTDKVKSVVIIIKPTDEANYKNVIDMLDEMAIDKVGTYTMVPVTPQEVTLLDKFKNAGAPPPAQN
jgi:biopolymer transport protein ExbD